MIFHTIFEKRFKHVGDQKLQFLSFHNVTFHEGFIELVEQLGSNVVRRSNRRFDSKCMMAKISLKKRLSEIKLESASS